MTTITQADRDAVEEFRNRYGYLGYDQTALHFAAELREQREAMERGDRLHEEHVLELETALREAKEALGKAEEDRTFWINEAGDMEANRDALRAENEELRKGVAVKDEALRKARTCASIPDYIMEVIVAALAPSARLVTKEPEHE